MGSIGDKKEEWITVAWTVLESEYQAIAGAVQRLDQNLARAVQPILDHSGKVVVSGTGKSTIPVSQLEYRDGLQHLSTDLQIFSIGNMMFHVIGKRACQ